ncbi:50S ribosomal protein L6 [Candidatus Odyssella acanthamoebae]|uniref:Large ribosomal subunit protein uL6 n=1 Tax=Candidatus Odyssella acanthamoebae TaxID=91604 RepID=A0A077AU81_9PROT|nr:50S ribosomal protein L6 [Candidatus Paracaedibacter acanthamoebae]AIK96752.1 50S ribosomal protein L6 [Candidatus Paracaedibacter acanthamoebae]
MSRVGKTPIKLPAGVNVAIANNTVEVSGKLGKLSMKYLDVVTVTNQDGVVQVQPANDSKTARINWGTVQRRVANMVSDVTNGVDVNLELIGVGYRANVQGNKVNLQLGFSHDIVYDLPAGITAKSDKPTSLTISGFDRQLVGQVAAEIRAYRRPEPYKGKGIIRNGEFVLRKEGKKK